MGGSIGSTIGRLALIGIGYAIGGSVGAAVGSIVGQYLFPPKIPDVEGPRLSDQGLTSSTQGAPIPIVYGTITVAGNVIYDSGLDEERHRESQSAKGGPSQEVTTYTYSRSFALALCEGPIVGVRRIWANGKIIYDTRVQQTGETDEDFTSRREASDDLLERMTIYLGSETQEPDPLLEADLGAGNVPAFRGIAYLVFEDYDVTDLGGRPPTFQVEVYTKLGSAEELDYLVEPKWVGYPIRGQDDQPYRITENAVYFAEPASVLSTRPNITTQITMGASVWALDGSQQLSSASMTWAVDIPAAASYAGQLDQLSFSVIGFVKNAPGVLAIGRKSWYGTLGSIPPHLWVIFYFNGQEMSSDSGATGSAGIDSLYSEVGSVNVCNYFDQAVYISFDDTTIRHRLYRWPTSPYGQPSPLPSSYSYSDADYGSVDTIRIESMCGDRTELYLLIEAYPTILPTFAYYVQQIDPETMAPTKRWLLDDGDLYISGDDKGLLVHGNLVAVAPSSDGNRRLVIWELNDDAVSGGAAGTSTILVNDASEFFDGNDGAQVFVDERLHRMKVRDRWIKLPNGINVGPPTLGEVVSDICDRAGMAADDYDVSELTETIDGYRIERVMSARGAIDPLRSFGYFDAVETAGQIKFPLRGQDSVATLDEDDLAAHESGEVPPLVALERTEDVELPRLVRVHYLMPHAEYQVGEQKATRLITDAVSAQDVDLVIAMTDDKAAQIAEVLLAEAWVGRESYKLQASPRWLALEPSDAITIPVEGESQRARITSIQHGMPGLLQIEAIRDDQIIYESTAAGVPSGIQEGTLGQAGNTLMLMIDGPALLDSHNEPGMYVAARGTRSSWRGAGLYESLDDGANYTRVLTLLGQSTMGVIESALAEGPSEIWDNYNSVIVALDEGTLESRTEDAVLNGANAAFVGGPGRWEVIQFKTATLISTGRYQISGFLRGRRGTEHAIGESVAGDSFVLCDTCTRFPLNNSAINQERLYKAVTFGQLIEAAGTYTVTPVGEALECYSPVHISRLWDNDTTAISFKWIRRARLSAEWLDNADAPLNEQTEAYEIDILDSTDAVVRTLEVTGEQATYTEAQQIEDFGSVQPTITVIVYQMSPVTGRGYGTEATL